MGTFDSKAVVVEENLPRLSGTNMLCKTCKLKCKQWEQIVIYRCPTYTPKKKKCLIQKQSKIPRRAKKDVLSPGQPG